jgi:hypothetical protein
MGTMIFLLPADLSPGAVQELERAWVATPDHMPCATRVQVELNRLIVEREVEESGYLNAPWGIEGVGRLLATTATLMERPLPYRLLVELARGKVNQLRCQAAEWKEDGLLLPATVEELIGCATRAVCRGVLAVSAEEADEAGQSALSLSHQAADRMIRDHIAGSLTLRHGRQPTLKAALSCQVSAAPAEETATELAGLFDAIDIAFTWSSIEPNHGRYDWASQDAVLDWALKKGLAVTGGPLIDFSAMQLPEWLWLWEADPTSLGRFMSDYVMAALNRYGDRIRRWHLTSASNNTSVLSLGEQDLLWLTINLARVARRAHPGLDLIIRVAQPWCDSMVRDNRRQAAFLFAETLARELRLPALDLEIVMGVTPRGSYCRDLLDTSRLLDAYAELGVPLRVTLGYPSASTVDPKADPELCVDAGYWCGGIDQASQAEWANAFVMLALSKPYVEAVNWVSLSDAERHQFPHCGVLDPAGKPKPSLQALQHLRETYLR